MGLAELVRHFALLMIIVELSCSTAAGRDQPNVKESRRHRYILEQRSTILEDLSFELRQVIDWCRENGLEQASAELTQTAS